MGVSFGETYFQQDTLQVQFWMCSMNTLMCCLIISLNGSGVGGPGHHTPQILTHVIIYFEPSERYSLQKQSAQSKNWNSKF
jgi:hypothetical protein